MVGRRELQQCHVSSFLNRGANTVDIEKLWVLFSLFFSFSPFFSISQRLFYYLFGAVLWQFALIGFTHLDI